MRIALPVDVTVAAAVGAAVSETASKLGPVTLLVNDAGTPGLAGLDWQVDPDEWFECVEVIVRGAFLLCRAVVPGMIARGSGRIINIASITGIRARPPITATSVAKTALIRLSESLALQLSEHGIHVFAIHPGGRAYSVVRILRFPNSGGAVRRARTCRIALRAPCERPV